MTAADDPRTLIAARLEKTALAVRYVAYFAVLALFFWGEIGVNLRDLTAVTVVVFLHALFVHWVLWAKRYGLFQSWHNFAIYLVEASLIVYFTGSEESAFFVLYLFVLVGYTAYAPRIGGILLATALCMAAYLLVIGIEWILVGIRLPSGVILAKLASIPACGWLLGSLRDLLRHAEEASQLRAQAVLASESTLRTILDNVADPILVYDEQESIIEANEQAAALLGVPRESLLGQKIRVFLFDDGTLADTLGATNSRGAFSGEHILVDDEGRERAVDLQVRSFAEKGRRVLVAVAHDVTERKSADEAARLAHVDLAKFNRELQQLNTMKTEFLATTSRRLRAPLCAILGYIDLLLADELGEVTPEQRKGIQACKQSALHVVRLMDEAFDFIDASLAQHTPPPSAAAPTRDAEDPAQPPSPPNAIPSPSPHTPN